MIWNATDLVGSELTPRPIEQFQIPRQRYRQESLSCSPDIPMVRQQVPPRRSARLSRWASSSHCVVDDDSAANHGCWAGSDPHARSNRRSDP